MSGKFKQYLQTLQLRRAIVQTPDARRDQRRHDDQTVILAGFHALLLVLLLVTAPLLTTGTQKFEYVADVFLQAIDLFVRRQNRTSRKNQHVRLQKRVEVLGKQPATLLRQVQFGREPLIWIFLYHAGNERPQRGILEFVEVLLRGILPRAIIQQLGILERYVALVPQLQQCAAAKHSN